MRSLEEHMNSLGNSVKSLGEHMNSLGNGLKVSEIPLKVSDLEKLENSRRPYEFSRKTLGNRVKSLGFGHF